MQGGAIGYRQMSAHGVKEEAWELLLAEGVDCCDEGEEAQAGAGIFRRVGNCDGVKAG